MLQFKRAFFNRTHALTCVPKALTSINIKSNINVIFLSKITLTLTLYRNVMFRLFNVRWDSSNLRLWQRESLSFFPHLFQYSSTETASRMS
jgi:hypothetical protein